jgi:hypothetical protein
MLNKPTQEKDAEREAIQKKTEAFLAKGGKIDNPQGMTEHSTCCKRCNRSVFTSFTRKNGMIFCCQRCADKYESELP